MEYELLKTAADTLTLPADMKRRIAAGCISGIAGANKRPVLRKSAAALAAAAICLSLTVSALAATGVLQGFFRDITNWRGTVVGTAYEQASEEITVDADVNGDTLTVTAAFVNPKMPPYSEAERLGIAAYRIVDSKGKTLQEGSAESAEVTDGQATLSIPLGSITGSCRLVITAFVTEKKADYPLTIGGYWEYAFSR